MKTLKELHHELVLAASAFKSVAKSQGFSPIDIGEVAERNVWLSREEKEKVANMLRNNEDPENYCQALVSEGKAFFEYSY